tara:strand:- start:157 stop:660 length:504 start_codon:yes stop_codon:yes gene_type:complete
MPVQSNSGNVIQTVQGIRRTPWSSNVGSSNVQIGLTATITPKFASSKILIILFLMYDWTRNNSGGGFKLFRGGTEINDARGDGYGAMYRVAADFGANANADQSGMTRTIVYLDDPNTTSTTEYRVYAYAASTYRLTICGAQYADGTTNQSDDGRFISTYTLLEIGAS